MSDIVDDTANHRLLWSENGHEAELVYRRNGRRLVLVHTEVPEDLGGRGIAGALVEHALEWARAEHLTLVPWCPYARRWLEKNSERVGEVAIDWSPAPA